MSESPKFSPDEGNLNRNCIWWATAEQGFGCRFPNADLQERKSCEGIIDEVCLCVKEGRPTVSLSEEQIQQIKLMPLEIGGGRRLPAGR